MTDEFQPFLHKGMVLELTAHEAGSLRLPGPPRPAKPASVCAPGAGRFAITRLAVSASAEGFKLAAQVTGRNIAYIYSEMLLKDEGRDRFYGPVVREHVRAVGNKETRGVSRPDWGDPVDVRVDVRPSLRLLTDGAGTAFCFSVPERYGSADHRLEGLYASAGGTVPLRAVLTFAGSGETKGIVVHKERGRWSTPRALAPKPGDRFTPFVQVFTPPAEDDGSEGGQWAVETALSTALTFGDGPLRLVTETPMPGDYLAGVVVQDLDGGLTRAYVPLAIGE